ncbi:paralemmin-2-like [Amphiprion ocellaris]|uniref:paralemmin-2-like n=1 Tax=Amphiprion ocellaris TaxID=80972 RepID=UPI002410C7AD|nr:paralemmin-2-like [Amphiprion ocellaris]XP_035805503.2 paralemmin-2-like [Amphiprion ocellaris]XP_035805505.2 paralemmin-2-like [Amphiprion ocellaris]XP_035805506.2 paralemmin-2-like [Amphiprion ocellaris]XP_035805507.2 paralemmin-2-like [Amphiprion ocellaris]XP_054861452.1 paralemmin-2-like [Amphiprion ocellaris]XP_054861453.1 paralemmin-2-like [Amphiprion ocellaris]
MAQRMFHESGEDGRSVLGMLAVQVERDPKTGATVVRSVSPVSAPAGVPKAITVFDDGRKSIHAIGGPAGQPSPEELGQILNVIDGVGMKVLLEEVTVVPNAEEIRSDAVEDNSDAEEKAPSFADMSEEDDGDNEQSDSSISDHEEAELTIEKCTLEEGNTDEETLMVVQTNAERVDHIEDERLEKGPVTLMFLGYTDATTGQEDQEGEITVERVIITEDGEEHVIGPETSAPLQSPLDQVEEQDAGKEDEVLQDIPLDENGAGVKVQAEEGDAKLDISPSPSKTEGDDTPKRKTCQCCSVM